MISRETCPSCKGDKWIKVTMQKGQAPTHRKCPVCNGSGFRLRIQQRPR